MKFKNLFSDPSWRWTSKNCYPNRLYGNGQKVGAVVVVRKEGRGQDFALNAAGLDSVTKAEADGRLKEAYVVFANQNGNDLPEVVASERATEVSERLHGVRPLDGQYGAYWWLTRNFMPTATSGESSDEPW
jgi:hypothetical protein